MSNRRWVEFVGGPAHGRRFKVGTLRGVPAEWMDYEQRRGDTVTACVRYRRKNLRENDHVWVYEFAPDEPPIDLWTEW